MKKKLIIILLFIRTIATNAQQTIAIAPVSPEKKNEICINTAPLFRAFLNVSVAEATRYSATYKRYVNEKSAWRVSIVADIINNDVYNFYENSENEMIILNKDSTIIKQKDVFPRYVSPHINIGYERLFGKHKLKWFYGIDLSVGYTKYSSYRQNIYLLKDTSKTSSTWIEAKESNFVITSETFTKALSLGLHPFMGAKYPISKHFLISAQISFDMFLRKASISIRENGVVVGYEAFIFESKENTGLLNDISLIYKF